MTKQKQTNLYHKKGTAGKVNPQELIEITKQIVDEIMRVDQVKIDKVEKKILFDGNQYVIKIPKKMADAAELNHLQDTVSFQLKTFPIKDNKTPELIIKIQRKEHAAEKKTAE